jgi:glycosyltransferase involved in cell wall biosynthesis
VVFDVAPGSCGGLATKPLGQGKAVDVTKYSIDETMGRIQRFNSWYCEFEVPPDAANPKLAGVNVTGYLRDESGWGEAARGYIRALRSLRVPVALNDLSELSSNRSEDQTLTTFDAGHPYDVNLVCIDAAQHFAIMSHIGTDVFEGRYSIGAWAWEMPSFPEKWYDRFAYYDEIWATSSFIANGLAPISPVPVVRIPPVLTSGTPGSREDGRRRLGISSEEFVYLFVFDFHSHLERKNPLALIDAFKLASAPSDPVRLVIKCVNADSDSDGFAAMNARARGYPIDFHAGYWPSQELRDLMAACDAYVSLHRSEGTGLTITDAMALGKPVIATSWSGNMDFMDVSNSFPVRYELVELQENVGPYRAGEVWADPSVEHAAEQMRIVFEDREEARIRGRAAKREIETNYSEEKVARTIRQRLEIIASLHMLPEFRREIRAFYSAYQRLTRHVLEVANEVVPDGAIAAVVSKGDKNLVELGGERKAWHFPRNEDGVYVGYHPADSAEAISHLEELHEKGAQFLLFPGTALWWLEHYGEFREHLDSRYRRVWNEEACVIYELAPESAR